MLLVDFIFFIKLYMYNLFVLLNSKNNQHIILYVSVYSI